MAVNHRFEFTDEDFQYICNLVAQYAGIHLTPAKRELVYGRLAKRLRLLGLESFSQYCAILRSGDGDEFLQCMNSITTNVTSFFRESHHFDFLAGTVFPEISSRACHQSRPRLRIWSAGCSTGEEPYSLAMVLRESLSMWEKWDAKILATDIDSDVLGKARNGIYQIRQIESVSGERRRKWFRKGIGLNDNLVQVSPELQSLVYYRKLNLTDREWPMQGPFDVIFCRNVVIYFTRETRQVLLNRFADLLTDNGYLFMGHSESLFGLSDRFSPTGKTIYRKIS